MADLTRRGYYYDAETGLYYLNSRYYNPEYRRFLNADGLTDSPGSYYAYCEGNPVMFIDPSGYLSNGWKWAISGVQIALGVTLIATGVGVGLGVGLVVGGSLGVAGLIVGDQIAGGVGSVLNGGGAISTGISLRSYGTAGVVFGGTLIAVGIATAVFGANEVVEGVSGTNYIKKSTGISDEVYGGLYFGLNIASAGGTIAGRLGMRYKGTMYERSAPSSSKPYARNINTRNEISYYNGKGKLTWSRHNTQHGNSSNPHWHLELPHSGHLNSRWAIIGEILRRLFY